MELNVIKKKPLRSIAQFAVPSVIGMLLTSFITIVDGLFIGNNVGKEGLAAVNLGLPILYVFLGIAIMIGVGGSTLAIQRLGAKKADNANNVFNQTVITLFCFTVIVTIIAKVLLNPILNTLHIANLVRVYINDYYSIMLMIYPIMMMNVVFSMFIRGEGKPQIFMQISILTNLVNVILDYIFISRYNMGVKGAAYASTLSIILGLIITILYFMGRKSKFKLGRFRFYFTDLKATVLNGSSELIGQLSMAITTGLYNVVILNIIGVIGVAAMTIIGYVGYMYSMIVIGIGQGMSPIVSYSFGANDCELVVQIRKLTQKIVFTCGTIIFIAMEIMGNIYARVFSNNLTLQMMVSRGIRIYSFAFLILGYNVIASFFFTSIGRAKESAIISSMRGLVILSLCIFLLPILFNENGIWLVIPVTEIITFTISFNMVKSAAREK